MSSKIGHAYILVVIQPGKEQEFADEVVSKGLILDSAVEKLDFVHGSFDFIVVLTGSRDDVDRRILEMRKIPFVESTETLIPFEMLNWDDVSSVLKDPAYALRKNDVVGLPSLELELENDCTSPIVIYSTRGGKTKKVAAEFASELNCPCVEINKSLDLSTINLSGYDLVLIGTGIYGACPNVEMVRFLKNANLDSEKQFALFLTWYRLGQNDKAVFNIINGILDSKGKKLLAQYFECPGDISKGHPNAEDLSAARRWVSKIKRKS
ncbi:MAG: flavodoxin domain-containing protein [Candidatus Bathyarchaeia archaeon]|jgi:flavodoxin